MKFPFSSYITLFFVTALLAPAAVTITAEFQPATVMLGDTAKYVVSVKETSESGMPEIERITSLPIPQSGGLSLQNGRIETPKQERITINFRTEYALTQNLVIEAVPPQIGNFTIPSYVFTYKGDTFTAPAATLRTIERPANAPPPVDELIFLRVDAPSQLYVGQTTSIAIKLYVHEQARYRGYDNYERNADGFTVSELTEATESAERVGQYRYKVITWPLTITPIQSGPQDLKFEFSVVAEMPQPDAQRDRFGRSNSPFGGSMFNSFFGRSERFNLFNEPTQIEVLPLPTVGQPDSFSGAIGDFSISVSTDAEESRVGEPIMLSLKVIGAGNFERISGPELAEANGWRGYEPESAMESSDASERSGVKRFDYVFIPQQAGKRMLPEVKFSFFDPDEGSYVELSAPPLAVQVAPSLQPQFTALATTNSNEAATKALNLSRRLSPEEALLTLDYRPAALSPSGYALTEQPAFYVWNAVALLAICIAGCTLRQRRRLATDQDYAQQHAARQEFKNALAATKTAESQANTTDFYRSCQEAVRLAATLRFRENLRATESDELRRRFQSEQISDSAIAATRQLFEQADAQRFSGNASTSADFNQARTQLNIILKAL